MEGKLLPYPLLESLTFFDGQAVALGNHGNHIDNIAKLLQDDNVNRLERMTRWLNEEQAAMNAGVLNVTLALCSKLLVEIGTILVLDVFDDGIPAAIVVYEVAVPRGVDDVEAQSDAILFNDIRDGLNLGGAANWLVWSDATFRVEQVRCEDGVD